MPPLNPRRAGLWVIGLLLAIIFRPSIGASSVIVTLDISGIPITAGSIGQYHPLRSGTFWTYRYPDGSLYTMRVLPGTTIVNGVATKAIEDTDGYTQYLSEDNGNVFVHGQIYAPSGGFTLYTPPIKIFATPQYFEQTLFSSGVAHTPYGDFPYASSFRVPIFETVTVPRGTFWTIRQEGNITFGGVTNTFTINFAYGVGIVKEVQAPHPNTGQIELIATNIKTALDFDGDGRSDAAAYGDDGYRVRTSSGSAPRFLSVDCSAGPCFGGAGWTPIAADFDGDGRTDNAVYLNGAWGIVRSSDGQKVVTGFGGPGFEPVAADYNGDGKADIAVYLDGVWSIVHSSDSAHITVAHGGPEWLPLPADYDGDGKADVAVYHPAGVWVIKRSTDGRMIVVGWGGPGYQPLPADYDGDGHIDIAVYGNGMWSILRRSDNGNTIAEWGGGAEDIPIPADHDGDGKADLVIYRHGQWLIKRSLDGLVINLN